MTRRIEPASSLVGSIAVPGDAAISHRAVLVGALGEEATAVEGFGRSADTESTVAAVRALGVAVDDLGPDRLNVHGAGLRGLREPGEPIECGVAGALVAGILAGQRGRFELRGSDEAGRRNTLQLVVEPLRALGAHIETPFRGEPLVIEGTGLKGTEYELQLACAEVKSGLLLAGLLARDGVTTVREPRATADHTELMLTDAGASISRRGASIRAERAQALRLPHVAVPGDFSAAAPFVVAATLLSGSELYVAGVGVNPTRSGLLDVLGRMGARITVFNRRRVGREPIADLEVRSAPLTATTVERAELARLIDEVPLLALAAGSARGDTVVRGVEDLRIGQPTWVETVTTALRDLGVRASVRNDAISVRGVPTRPKGGSLDTGGDPRLAILGAGAGLVSKKGVTVEGAEAAAISFPGFFQLLEQIAQR